MNFSLRLTLTCENKCIPVTVTLISLITDWTVYMEKYKAQDPDV